MARVLIIDDEPWICRALMRMLKVEHGVVAVNSVREALLAIAEERFDLVVCDVRLGNHSGLLLRAELAERDPAQAARIIFMSGDTSELAGVNSPILTKPFEAGTVYRLLARCLHTWGPLLRPAQAATAR